MSSALPFQIVSTGIFLLSNVALFIHLRRRVGDELALLGTTLVLFLGASWIDLLWSFQVAFSGSIAAGLGALLALERDEQRSDAVACGLLVIAVAFSELGVSFALAALVSVALGPRPRRNRLYVALVPLALYAIWFLGWGHKGSDTFSAHNVLVSPKYVFEAISQAIASLLGLATPLTGSGLQPVGLVWGELLLVMGIILAAWRRRLLGRSHLGSDRAGPRRIILVPRRRKCLTGAIVDQRSLRVPWRSLRALDCGRASARVSADPSNARRCGPGDHSSSGQRAAFPRQGLPDTENGDRHGAGQPGGAGDRPAGSGRGHQCEPRLLDSNRRRRLLFRSGCFWLPSIDRIPAGLELGGEPRHCRCHVRVTSRSQAGPGFGSRAA